MSRSYVPPSVPPSHSWDEEEEEGGWDAATEHSVAPAKGAPAVYSGRAAPAAPPAQHQGGRVAATELAEDLAWAAEDGGCRDSVLSPCLC